MIRETDVRAALPSSGWLREYVLYALERSYAPACYHLGTGLGIMTQMVAPRYAVTVGGQSIHPNLNVLVAGPSGEGKSFAMKIGYPILAALGDPDPADPSKLITPVLTRLASYEAYVESFRRHPQRLIWISEFGTFLTEAKTPNGARLKDFTQELWDCSPLNNGRVDDYRKGKVQEPVTDARGSILAAVATKMLEERTTEEDWDSGFLGRFLFFYGERERESSDPPADYATLASLSAWAARIRKKAKAFFDIDDQASLRRYRGFTPGASSAYNAWSRSIERRRKLPGVRLATAMSRAQTQVRKIAALFALERGLPYANEGTGSWFIDERCVCDAIAIGELHFKSLQYVESFIASNRDMLDRYKVLRWIKPEGTLIADLIGPATGLPKKRVYEVIDSLVEEKRVRRSMNGSNMQAAFLLSDDERNAQLGRNGVRGGTRSIQPTDDGDGIEVIQASAGGGALPLRLEAGSLEAATAASISADWREMRASTSSGDMSGGSAASSSGVGLNGVSSLDDGIEMVGGGDGTSVSTGAGAGADGVTSAEPDDGIELA